jgi:hypothetical protein
VALTGATRRKGPDGGAGAGQQGVPIEALHMHSVLRVVRLGCAAGVSFEWLGSVAQDTDTGCRKGTEVM